MVFEPAGDGAVPGSRPSARHLEARLAALPRFRQRLSAPATGGLTWPAWEQDPAVRHRHPRAPGGAPGARRRGRAHGLGRRTSGRTGSIAAARSGRWCCWRASGRSLGPRAEDPPRDGRRRRVGRRGPRAARRRARARPGPARGGPGRARRARDRGRTAAVGPARRRGAHHLGAGCRPCWTLAALRDALHRSRALAELLARDELVAAPATSLNRPIGKARRFGVVRAPLEDLKLVKRSSAAPSTTWRSRSSAAACASSCCTAARRRPRPACARWCP